MEWSFAVLRALAMIGGTIALFLVPHPPEHQIQLTLLAWGFVSYKLLLFLTIWIWPGRLQQILLGTVVLDLGFVGCFVWLGGGLESHFYLLFYLLIALTAAHFGPGVGVAAAGGGGLFYALGSLPELTGVGWHHLAGRTATFFLLGGSLGYLSQRERQARGEAERLNQELLEQQGRLERAYRELQGAQERLVRSERLAVVGELSAKVSHEVRNPLGSISLNAELLEDEIQGLPPERRDEAAAILRAIRSQVEVLSGVTEEYLRSARFPAPRRTATILGPLLEELSLLLRPELEQRGVRLEIRAEPGLPAAEADPGQLRQLLLNLVRNAAEAMPEGGAVTVAVRTGRPPSGGAGRREEAAQAPGGRRQGESSQEQPTGGSRNAVEDGGRLPVLVVEVRDTGGGIPEEIRGKIFEPFFTTKEEGTGLGLAVARRIAQDHGGELTAGSPPGGGALFRLTLPIAEGGSEA